MERQEQFLAELLQKTVVLVSTLEERYRDAAFPVILQALIKAPDEDRMNNVSTEVTDKHNSLEPRIPLTMSVNEFFRQAAPDSHPGRFVCAAYYLLHTGKAEQFTMVDIMEIYGRLREPKPKNPSDVINQCIRKVHIIDAPNPNDGQKSWVITPNGEKYVEGLLNDNATGNI